MGVVNDWGTAVWNSLSVGLALAFDFIPRLLGFIVILVIGIIVAKALEKGLTLLLRKLGFDRVADRIGLSRLEQRMGMRVDAAGLLGRLVYWFVF